MKTMSKLEAFRNRLKVQPIIIIEENEKQLKIMKKGGEEKGISFDEWEAWTAWNAWEAWTAWKALDRNEDR